jgi:manganese transport protein
LVQTRKFDRSSEGIKRALKYNFIDSAIALNLAFFVNAAILILAASTFYKNGYFEVAEIQDAHRFLEPLLGTEWAPILFAVALIAAGQSSTITGTLAGQIIMEGYLNLRIQPWVRRIITRLIAIVPALIVISVFGEEVTGKMLIFSQVVLSLQLGFAIIPLIHFVSDRTKMQEFVISKPTRIAAWVIAIIIVSLNVKLVFEEISIWIKGAEDPTWLYLTVVPIATGFLLLLLYIAIRPLVYRSPRTSNKHLPHLQDLTFESAAIASRNKVAIAVDFSKSDEAAINHALKIAGSNAHFTLIHVVETVGALMYGSETADHESAADKKLLEDYKKLLAQKDITVNVLLGYGKPHIALSELVAKHEFDLLVMGTHGHAGFKDLLFGTTIDKLRHRLKIPLFIVNA